MTARRLLLAATVAATGCALLVPTAASAATPAGSTSAGSTSAALQTWGSSQHYASGQFVVTNDSASAQDWSLTFTVPSGEYQNHSDWNVDATVRGDRVTLTPKGGALEPGMSEYVSFGIAGDGSTDLGVTGCDLDGADVQGCAAGDEDTAPTAPRDVRVQDVRHDRVTVSWTPGEDDDRVLRHTVDLLRDGTVIRQHILPGASGSSQVVDGLDAATTYQVRVTAHDTAGQATSSATTTFSTVADPADGGPVAPTQVRVNTEEPNRVIVNWHSAPEDGVLGFQVGLYAADGTIIRSHVVGNAAQAAAIVDRLEAGTAYQVDVTAYDTEGRTATSERVAFTTAR